MFTSLARTAALRAAPRMTAIRSKATAAAPSIGSYKDVNMKVWTSDVGAYPMIGILGLAMVGASSFIGYVLFFHDDVQMDPKKRNAIVRDWGKK